MPKKKKKQEKIEAGFILRNTTIREIPKKEHLGFNKRKVKRFTTYITKGKRKFVQSYVTIYNEGNVIRRTEVMYLKDADTVERKVEKGAKKFRNKKSKLTNFTSVVQYYEGKKGKTKKARFNGKVTEGSHITKAKRLQALLKTDSKVGTINKINRYLDESLKLENDQTSLLLIKTSKRKYHTTVGKYHKKRKGKKK